MASSKTHARRCAALLVLSTAVAAVAGQPRQGGRVSVGGDLVAVSQPASHAVLLYRIADDATPVLVASLADEGGRPGQLSLPNGVALDRRRGRLYVSDGQAARVQAFEILPDRLRFMKSIGGPGSGASQFDRPGGVAVAADGRLYVADTGNRRIQVLDDRLRPLLSFGSEILRAPVDVTLDGDRVLVLDAERDRIDVFDRSGRPAGEHLDLGDGSATPFGLTRALDGTLLVSDSSAHAVRRLDRVGAPLATWGGTGGAAGSLFVPMGVAVDARGDVLVLDRRSNRLQTFSLDGRRLGAVTVDPLADTAAAAER